jgi:hypothetical protein
MELSDATKKIPSNTTECLNNYPTPGHRSKLIIQRKSTGNQDLNILQRNYNSIIW